MAPLTVLIGRSARSASRAGASLSSSAYSKAPIFWRADRRDQVLRGERVGDVLAGKAARLQRERIEVDLDLAQLAAERPGDRRPRHRHQRRAHLVDADVGEGLLGEALARTAQLNRIGTVEAL